MVTATTLWREPVLLQTGDTLLFERRLSEFPASLGWNLLYEMRGGIQQIQFQSTADGDAHNINVPAATTALWQPADYILTGTAINAVGNVPLGIAAGETHRVYYGDLKVVPTLAGSPENIPETTHYQRMVTMLQAVAEGKAGSDILESTIEGVRFSRMTPEQFTAFYEKYYNLRQNEIDGIRAKNGQKSRNKIHPRFRVIPGWPYGVPGESLPGPFPNIP